MWIEPKTDWMPEDVYSLDVDLTRVEGNIHEIRTRMESLGYEVDISEKTAWTKRDFLSASELNRILGNLRRLEEAIHVPDGLPELEEQPDQGFFTAAIANALERHTLALKRMLDGMEYMLVQCGTIQSGEAALLPQ